MSLGAGETVMGYLNFEEWLCNHTADYIKHLQGGNGIFTANMLQKYCENKGQSQIFHGVGAQHQNDKSGRDIQTIINMARTFVVHFSLF